MLYDIVILGSGPAGYSAALYATRFGRSLCLLEGHTPGGQLTITKDVENYLGFTHIGGRALTESFEAHVRSYPDVHMVKDHGLSVEEDDDAIVVVGEKETYRGRSLIVCTGARARWLGVPGEEALRNHGVSACATCDGFFFRQKDVCVVGGGNTAVEDALHLSGLARHVTLIHRSETFRAQDILLKRLQQKKNVSFLQPYEVRAFHGKNVLEEVTVSRRGACLDDEDGDVRRIAVSGCFVAIGHDPASGCVASLVKCTDHGYIHVRPGTTHTSHPRIFAAGDVQDARYRQAITSAAQGCMAAIDAHEFLK